MVELADHAPVVRELVLEVAAEQPRFALGLRGVGELRYSTPAEICTWSSAKPTRMRPAWRSVLAPAIVNAGVIVSCAEREFLEARIELDEARVLALDPAVELDTVRSHLASISIICAGGAGSGPIGKLPPRERFHWLTAPRSTIIQTSRVHTGRCMRPQDVIEHLLDAVVRLPRPTAR